MGKKPGYKGRYASARKPKIFAWIFTALLAMIAVIALFYMNQSKTQYAETIPTTHPAETRMEVAAEETEPNETVYMDVLQEFAAGYQYAEPMTYTFYDFDGDGMQELLLGSGDAIRMVLKEENGEIEKIWESADQSYVYLCEGDILWDASTHGNLFTDTVGNAVEYVYYKEERHSWYRKNEEAAPDVPIDEAQAQDILASFQRVNLGWKSLSGYSSLSELMKQKEPVQFGLYRQALQEKWDMGQCNDAGISYMVGFFIDRPTEFGYAWLDLDGGEEELLITDGRNILDFYVMRDGKLELLFSGGERYAYTLMEDNRIFFQGAGSAFTSYYTLYRLDDSVLAEDESYIFDGSIDPDDPWFFSPDGETLGEPCGDFNVEARLAEFTPVEIPFTPFF